MFVGWKYAQAFSGYLHLLPSKPHGGSLGGATPRIHSISRLYRNSCSSSHSCAT